MKKAKWDMPLSKRAYEKIKEKAMIGVRIAGREDDFDDFIETIDLYITKGKVSMPWGDYHDIYDIIFHMIKDDIDTAMRRSREARERAAARRKSKEAVINEPAEQPVDQPIDKPAQTLHTDTGTSVSPTKAGQYGRIKKWKKCKVRKIKHRP